MVSVPINEGSSAVLDILSIVLSEHRIPSSLLYYILPTNFAVHSRILDYHLKRNKSNIFLSMKHSKTLHGATKFPECIHLRAPTEGQRMIKIKEMS